MGKGLKILLSNDDGIRSEGLKVLYEKLSEFADVIVVAPDRERSAVGRALTLHRPLRCERISENWYAVDGTPTSCVYIGVHAIMNGEKPDMIVGGINRGPNLGEDITYSGTVSVAMEGALLGIPSVAFSLATFQNFQWESAAEWAKRIVLKVIEEGIPEGCCLNVNIPNLPFEEIKGVMVTRQGKKAYSEKVEARRDPWGRVYYWIGGEEPNWKAEPGTDYWAVKNGYISVTPIHLDLTDYRALEILKKRKW
ncbi:MAG: 5'/3'-nucleotidase SurE [Desulfurobacterium sp.]|nr:MAG: 5'/3'-nucleotidase SurE [Desulfurobacterium sp.]